MAHFALSAALLSAAQLFLPLGEELFHRLKGKLLHDVESLASREDAEAPHHQPRTKTKVLSQNSFLPNIFFFINSCLWAAYGAQKENVLLEIGGCMSALLTGFYLYVLSRGKASKRKQSLVALAWVGMVLFSIELLDEERRVSFLGMFCCLTYTLTYISPLFRLKKIIRARDPSMLPSIVVIVLGTLSSVCWILYGVTIQDTNLMIPNVIGIIAGLFQLFLATNLHKDAPIFEFNA